MSDSRHARPGRRSANLSEPRRDSMSVVRSGETGWKPLQQSGVVIKVLRSDKASGASTFLLRFDAGARFPRHDDPGGEEGFVVVGERRVGADRLTACDCFYAPPMGEHVGAAGGRRVLRVRRPPPGAIVEMR